MLLRLSLRNMLRNRRRSALTGLVIGIGLAVTIFTDAYIQGLEVNLFASATDGFLGHAQLHAPEFRKAHEVELTLKGDHLVESLRQDPHIRAVAPRVMSIAMVSSANEVRSVMLTGVDPVAEQQMSRLDAALVEGQALAPAPAGKILLGARLAQHLSVTVGDKVVVTLAQANTGELSQELFRVGGLFRFNSRALDESMAYVHLAEGQRLLALGPDLHEVALRLDSPYIPPATLAHLRQTYGQGDNELLSWMELLPEFTAMMEMTDLSMAIMVLIVFGIVGLSILNSLFMSFYERTYEFGVLAAIGTKPRTLVAMVMLEAAWLAGFAVLAGILLGFVLTGAFVLHGIDYGGVTFQGVTVADRVYPVFTQMQFTLYPLLFFAFCLLVALYPAWHISKLVPAQAMKPNL